jgi:UDP-N-acetylglucosamine--N-acetylmuramyl-(pentapeptide) pyrophosphoryl-undecaprenol N-acetylglucosamine transferase
VQPEQFSIVFAGGGTGGHLFPAIAIADEIKKRNPEAAITFVGTKGKIEARLVPDRGYRFASIWISGLKRKLAAENILFPLKIIVALVQSFFLMKRLKPQAVVGTGGYVAGPVVFVASLLGIPTLIQEQNSYPGVTTRLLARRVDEVHITFESSVRYLGTVRRLETSGNPTRAVIGSVNRIEGAKYFGLDPAKRTLLVFGGSLGASSINNAVLNVIPEITGDDFQLIWQTGESDFERVASFVAGMRERDRAGIKIFAFIEQMQYAYGACDLAICRAGATTVAELTRAGVPSVLVPYPYAAADHQTENAKAMVEGGASLLLPDMELSNCLSGTIRQLLGDPERLAKMSDRARMLGKPNAAAVLAEAVMKLAKMRYGRTGKSL